MKRVILSLCLAILGAGLALGGTVYGPTTFMGDVRMGTWRAISNVTWSLESGGAYSNAPGYTNTYRVCATNHGGRLPASSNIVVAFTGSASSNAVRLAWPVAGGVSGYVVERSFDLGATWTNWLALAATETNWVDTGSNAWVQTAFETAFALIPSPSGFSTGSGGDGTNNRVFAPDPGSEFSRNSSVERASFPADFVSSWFDDAVWREMTNRVRAVGDRLQMSRSGSWRGRTNVDDLAFLSDVQILGASLGADDAAAQARLSQAENNILALRWQQALHDGLVSYDLQGWWLDGFEGTGRLNNAASINYRVGGSGVNPTFKGAFLRLQGDSDADVSSLITVPGFSKANYVSMNASIWIKKLSGEHRELLRFFNADDSEYLVLSCGCGVASGWWAYSKRGGSALVTIESGTVETGVWTHAAVSWGDDDHTTLWINGVRAGSSGTAYCPGGAGFTLKLFQGGGGSNEIEELGPVTIWTGNGTLGDESVAAIYALGPTGDLATVRGLCEGTVASWRMDDGVGTTIAEFSDPSLNGTISGSTYTWYGTALDMVAVSTNYPFASPASVTRGLWNISATNDLAMSVSTNAGASWMPAPLSRVMPDVYSAVVTNVGGGATSACWRAVTTNNVNLSIRDAAIGGDL